MRQIADELRVPVLYDGPFDVPPMFGSRQTPSAILLDEEGRIASGVALGGHNILALVGARSGMPQRVELAAPGT